MYNNQQSPVYFVNGEIRLSKQTGSHYLWSKPFDLEACIRELGSTMATITVTVPKNAKNEFQRVIVIKPAMVNNQYRSTAQTNEDRMSI